LAAQDTAGEFNAFNLGEGKRLTHRKRLTASSREGQPPPPLPLEWDDVFATADWSDVADGQLPSEDLVQTDGAADMGLDDPEAVWIEDAVQLGNLVVDGPLGPELDGFFGDRRDGALRSASAFGTQQVVALTNPATGRPLPVARSPAHCFLKNLLETVVVGDVEKITFVGMCEMERYVLGVDPSFDDEQVKNALRVAIRVIAIDIHRSRGSREHPWQEAELDRLLAEQVRFLSRDEYRAEVGGETWQLETGFVPGPRR
jgi:hypothetical protein